MDNPFYKPCLRLRRLALLSFLTDFDTLPRLPLSFTHPPASVTLRPSRRALAFGPVYGAVWCLLSGGAWAQSEAPQAMVLILRASPMLQERITDAERSRSPVFIEGQTLTGRPDMDVVIQGQARLRRSGLAVQAERIEYDQTQDILKAQGQVRISREGNRFEGPLLELQADTFQGQFLSPTFELGKGGGHGQAQSIEFVDAKRAIIRNASYTTCTRLPGPSWLPDWVLKATSLSLDDEESTAQTKDMQLRFMDVPLLAVPSLSFALNADRKSGFLSPTIGIDSISGLEVATPYYLNIAPNRDATVTATAMTKRGVALDTEFRYLEDTYQGKSLFNFMPGDALRQQNRWGLSAQHNGSFDSGLNTLGRIGLGLNVNRVSDDNYWRDFPRSGLSFTQRLLPSSGTLSWAQDDLSMTAQVLRWQTLQDATSPITPPYDRSPQIVLRHSRWDANGLDLSTTADTTRFESDYSRIPGGTTAVLRNGQRSYVSSQVSLPWVSPWGFVTPKLQLHATRYQLDNPLSDGRTSVNRVLPTFSLDTGVVLERDANVFGRAIRQTLEPRAFYLRTPYADQSMLPLYDTGATDFNLSTIYSANPYVGQDRIADNNLLTLGVTSRYIDANTGAELAKIGFAQRMRFSDQLVTLPGETAVAKGFSDMLVGAGVRWDDRWSLDSLVQFNTQSQRAMRTTVGARYSPTPYRVVNAAYRMTRDQSEQIDVGWQWPLRDFSWGDADAGDTGAITPGQGLGPGRWYSVGRMNFSLKDNRMVDSIFGLEFDAGCWLGRVVFERLQSTVSTASSRLLFQLEFVGLARIGSSPLKTLRDNIPRYQYLREDVAPPSRFLQYE
jgi:LPS-assembly protein